MRTKSEIVETTENRLNDLKTLIDYVEIDNIVMVEVGCFVGWSTITFCDHEKVQFLYGIDSWQGKYRGRDMSGIEKQFDNRMESCGKYQKIKMPSLEASRLFEDASLDLVYLDALHTYRGVKNDIKAWKSKVKVGGYLTGHDYRENANKGVKSAVNNFLGEPEKVFCDSSWLFKIRE